MSEEPHPLTVLSRRVHKANEKWWRNPKTGEIIVRNVGEMLALVHSEISEALEGHRKNLKDDKLPQYYMYEVELIDAIIRIFDMLGAIEVDTGKIFEDKMAYNATRYDHSDEGRLKENGKKY